MLCRTRCAQSKLSYVLDDPEDISPQDIDVLLSDLGENDLKGDVARELSTEYLGTVDIDSTPAWPVEGVVYGRHFRVILQLTVKRRGQARSVLFLLDTGSPFTYVNPSTLYALGFKDSLPLSFQAEIHGQKMTVYCSPQTSHFKDINLLGCDFLRATQSDLRINYKTLTATLAKA